MWLTESELLGARRNSNGSSISSFTGFISTWLIALSWPTAAVDQMRASHISDAHADQT
jgi:hypothetical protein